MKTRMPYKVYPEKMKSGKWKLIRMTGLRMSSSSFKLWEHAKLPNGRAMQFDTHEEAVHFAKEWNKIKDTLGRGLI